MKKIYFLLPFLTFTLLFSSCSSDDDNPETQYIEEIQLKTQEEVDNFGATTQSVIRNVIRIGDFDISNNSINNLDALSSLTSVGGIRIDRCNALTNIDGLSNLVHIENGGELINLNPLNIQYCPLLENINALSTLQNVGSIYINNNVNLTDFCGIQTASSTVDKQNDGTFWFTIRDNAFNPSMQNIIDGNCSL